MKLRPQLARYLLIATALLTLGIGIANWRQRAVQNAGADGVLWWESAVGLVASSVATDQPGFSAGIRPGDVLYSINTGNGDETIASLQDYSRRVSSLPVGSEVFYTLSREGAPVRARLTLGEAPHSTLLAVVLAVVGVLYLLLGAWVLWRRFSNRRAPLFVLYSIASFALFAYSYSGRFDALDWTVYWLDVVAMLLQPALFAHLCLTWWIASKADAEAARATSRNTLFGLYATAAFLALVHFGFAIGFLRASTVSLSDARWWIDRLETGYLAVAYMIGTALLAVALKSARSRLLWKQLIWVLGGALLAFAPFTAGYAIPYFAGVVPTTWMSLSALSLIALPSAMAYAMARHRLLDVDVALGRGAAWALATGVLLGSYLGIAALVGESFRRIVPEAGTLGLLIAVIAAGLLLRPLQSWFQRHIDTSFLRHRYDYREAVLKLGAQLGQHSSREQIARSLLEPLLELLELERAAVLVPTGGGEFRMLLGCSVGEEAPFNEIFSGHERQGQKRRNTDPKPDSEPDLGFLRVFEETGDGDTRPARPTRHDWLHFTGGERDGADHPGEADYSEADHDEPLDGQLWAHEQWRSALITMRMPYYFPCRAKGRLVAVLGIGRTIGGETLSEQDEALIATLCGYLALAMESGELLESLSEKAQQYADLQQFSENILESINVGVLAVTLDDRVEAINTPLELMVPVPFHQSKGHALQEVLPADLYTEYERSKLDMGVHTINRYRVAGDNQPDRILNIAIAPLLSRNCECIGRLLIFDDVTDRIALETQLAQADKLSSLGLLAAGVAHEVNTPLTVISTQAQMLQKSLEKSLDKAGSAKAAPAGQPADELSEKTSKTLQRIISQTFRASEIVNSLLKFSRSSLSSGSAPESTAASSFAPVELNQVISETILLVEHSLKVAEIHVETHLEPGLALISGHAGKLQQVMLNLILNARDAMPRGGKLRLTTWTEADTVHVEIRDTGMGIAPEALSRIYDPFFTTKGPGKAPGRDGAVGTGLGLAVTYGIVQEHSGVINVESKPGAGTRFELQFPALRKPVHA